MGQLCNNVSPLLKITNSKNREHLQILKTLRISGNCFDCNRLSMSFLGSIETFLAAAGFAVKAKVLALFKKMYPTKMLWFCRCWWFKKVHRSPIFVKLGDINLTKVMFNNHLALPEAWLGPELCWIFEPHLHNHKFFLWYVFLIGAKVFILPASDLMHDTKSYDSPSFTEKQCSPSTRTTTPCRLDRSPETDTSMETSGPNLTDRSSSRTVRRR